MSIGARCVPRILGPGEGHNSCVIILRYSSSFFNPKTNNYNKMKLILNNNNNNNNNIGVGSMGDQGA